MPFVDLSTPQEDTLSADGFHPNDTVVYPWMGGPWHAAIKLYLHRLGRFFSGNMEQQPLHDHSILRNLKPEVSHEAPSTQPER